MVTCENVIHSSYSSVRKEPSCARDLSPKHALLSALDELNNNTVRECSCPLGRPRHLALHGRPQLLVGLKAPRPHHRPLVTCLLSRMCRSRLEVTSSDRIY